MRLDELLPLIPVGTRLILRNAITYQEAEPELLENLIKLRNFLSDARHYEVEKLFPVPSGSLLIDINYRRA